MKAIMSNLLDACKDGAQRTPLHHACINGHMELAMALVDSGADIHARDVTQYTPLHYACINGHMELAMALVDRGADVDAEDDNQRTPLLFACVHGNSEVALALISRGANVHATEGATDEDEWYEDEFENYRPRQGTSAHYASMRGLLEVVISLMDELPLMYVGIFVYSSILGS